MRRCELGGCTRLHFAGRWCLEHYVDHHHDLTRESALAIRAASGHILDIAREHRTSIFRVWEIRHGS